MPSLVKFARDRKFNFLGGEPDSIPSNVWENMSEAGRADVMRIQNGYLRKRVTELERNVAFLMAIHVKNNLLNGEKFLKELES